MQRFLSAVVAGFLFSAACQAGESALLTVRLTGLLQIGNSRSVLLEIPDSIGRLQFPSPLLEGDSLGDVDVVRIAPAERLAIVRQAGQESVLTLPVRAPLAKTGAEAPCDTVVLAGASLGQTFDVCQKLSSRIIVRSPLLPATQRISVQSGPVESGAAMKQIEQSLAGSGILLRPHAEKFMIALPSRDKALLNRLPTPPAPVSNPVTPKQREADENLRAAMQFQEADLSLVLRFYQFLTQTTVLWSGRLPVLKMSLGVQQAITRHEAAHACEIWLALGGLRVVPDGQKFVFVVPEADTGGLPAIMKWCGPVSTAARTQVPDDESPYQRAMQFEETDLPTALNVYERLTGTKVLRPPTLPRVRITLHPETRLTRQESVHALRAVLILNGVRLEKDDRGTERVVAIEPVSAVPDLKTP